MGVISDVVPVDRQLDADAVVERDQKRGEDEKREDGAKR